MEATKQPTPTSDARVSELQDLAKEHLGQREYDVWSLIELDAYTPSEVAVVLSESPSAIRGVLHRARRKLAMLLDNDERAG